MAVSLILPLLLAGCGGRAVNKKTAHGAIIRSSGDMLRGEDVDIRSASPMGSNRAVAEATVRVGVSLEKVKGEWTVRDIRLGRDEWVPMEDLVLALERIRTEQTRGLLESVAAALERYYSEKQALPEFQNYITLSDALHPAYMSPLIRLDAWRRPLLAYRSGINAVRLLSKGADGSEGTGDDIELNRTFRR